MSFQVGRPLFLDLEQKHQLGKAILCITMAILLFKTKHWLSNQSPDPNILMLILAMTFKEISTQTPQDKETNLYVQLILHALSLLQTQVVTITVQTHLIREIDSWELSMSLIYSMNLQFMFLLIGSIRTIFEMRLTIDLSTQNDMNGSSDRWSVKKSLKFGKQEITSKLLLLLHLSSL